MSGRRHWKRRTKTPIEKLALEYLSSGKTFSRQRLKRRIIRNFGWRKTNEAIERMAETLTLCDPNFRRPL